MRANEFINDVTEEKIDEMPLPADWDPEVYKPGVTFKQRLAYALERAKKVGAGSSRVAMNIEYQGRPTVLKIAKNQKGLAQNSAEADILSDGYARQLEILIPIIDYDTNNPQPLWIHTEMAQRASEQQLCKIIGCSNLYQLIMIAKGIAGHRDRFKWNLQKEIESLRNPQFKEPAKTDEQIESIIEYANQLADLNRNFEVELGDLDRKANWGLYKGRPVVLDVGFNSNVAAQYYSK